MSKNQLVAAVASVFLDKLPEFNVPEGENKAQMIEGAKKADSFLRAEAGNLARRITLWTEVAKFETKEHALAFCDGFAARSKEFDKLAEKSKNESDKALAAGVASDISRMRRVARAVFGYETKDAKGNAKQVKGWGAEKVVAHLSGKGTWQDKIGTLPGGRDKPGTVTNPVQRRITAADSVGAQGSVDVLEKVLGIPQGNAVSKPKQAENVLATAIKAAPDKMLMSLSKALADRLLTSKDESMKDLGTSLRDAIKMEAGADKPKRTLKQKETQ